VAEPIGNPPGPAHALRTHARTSDKIDAPAACATLSSTMPFHFVHTAGGVVTRTRNVSEYMLVFALYLVVSVSLSSTVSNTLSLLYELEIVSSAALCTVALHGLHQLFSFW